MHLPTLVTLPLLASAANILLSNDDGWAELNIRTFYNALVSGGNSVVISAPADNKSGTGSPSPLLIPLSILITFPQTKPNQTKRLPNDLQVPRTAPQRP